MGDGSIDVEGTEVRTAINLEIECRRTFSRTELKGIYSHLYMFFFLVFEDSQVKTRLLGRSDTRKWITNI